MTDRGEVTRLLDAVREGEPGAMDRLFPLIYEELRSLARRQLGRGRAGHTLQATALVHEAYVKLAGASFQATDRAHFLAIAARAMRQVLVEHAPRRQAAVGAYCQRARSLLIRSGMCRIYAFRANEPTKVECTLVHAQNALMSQSRADLRGEAHPDGWGIAFYEDGGPRPAIEKRATAAYDDLHFSATAERVYARTVLAHVRQATVGDATLTNAHPFSYGRWTFAHNGTIRAFDRVGPRLEAETEPEFLRLRRGTTDSELAFCWLLSRMSSAGIDLDQDTVETARLVELLAEGIRFLEDACVEAAATEPAKLNIVLTDGSTLLASRWRNSVYWVMREGLHDCEICGVPHVDHERGARYRAVDVASEPLSDEVWEELPECSILAVGADLEVAVHPV